MPDQTRTGVRLGRGEHGEVAQVGSYRTDLYQNLDGQSASASSTAFTGDQMIRLVSYTADNWVKRGTGTVTAVATEGMLIPSGSELTMVVYDGEKIATIGGELNIVPVLV